MKLFPRKVWKRIVSDVDFDPSEARAAVQQSVVNLEDTLATRVEVNQILSRLAKIRREDHFAEKIRRYVVGEE